MELRMKLLVANHVVELASHSLSFLERHECWFQELHSYPICLHGVSYLAITS